MKSFKVLPRLFTLFGLIIMPATVNAIVDVCYSDKDTSGFCTPFGGLFCSHETTIKSVSTGLSDINISKGLVGFSMSFAPTLKIGSETKTLANDNPDGGDAIERAEAGLTFGTSVDNTFGTIGMGFGLGGYGYHLGDMALNTEKVISDGYMMSMGFTIPTSALVAEYIKGGIHYSVPVPPCSGTPYFTISDANVTEGNSGTKTMSFTVTLTNPPAGAGANDKIDLRFSTVGSPATGATATGGTTISADYITRTNITANNLTVSSFPYTFNVTINGDTNIENNETFFLDVELYDENDINAVLIDSRGVGTIIDDDTVGGGGGGVTPPIASAYANVDVVNDYSGLGGTYHSWINTKVSAQPLVTLNAVYLGNDPTNPVPQPYTPSGPVNQAASITVLYKLADMSGGETCANAPTADLYKTDINGNIVYVNNKPVPATAIIAPTSGTSPSVATSTTFTMQYLPVGMTAPLAKRDVRIKYKSVDFNQLIIDSGIQCAQKSSTGGVVEGIPSCLIAQPNDNNENQNNAIQNYTTIFGQTAYQQCYTANGQPCAASQGGIGLPPYDSIYGCFECSIGNMPYTCSNDNFAIRPNNFNIDSMQTDFPNLLRSAEDYNLSVYAYDYGVTSGTNGSDDYNIIGATSLFDLNTTKYFKDGTIASDIEMLGVPHWSAYDFNMTNGVSWSNAAVGSEVAGTQFDDVGKINLRVVDANWSAVDINNPYDSTPRDCSTSGAYICGDKNVTYIPHSFDFNELNITNNNGNPGSFTYIANEVDQMAGRIHAQIRALNKDGNVTPNFATFPLWENNISITPVVTSGLYLHPDANETTITDLALGFTAGIKTIPWNETNTSQYLRFNFQRDFNLATPPSPFDVNGSDLNILVASTYTDPEDANTAFINGSRNGDANGSSKFVYGRIIPRDVRIFGTNTPFTANAWYEVYNTPSIGATALIASKNDALWYTNILHNDVSDGDANVTQVQTNGAASAASPSFDTNTFTAGVETYVETTGWALNGYKVHIDTVPWLWYGMNALNYLDPVTGNLESACLTHPCFNINVVPAVGATGSAKSTNESTKASKASTGGGGTWRSTTDYAPAVR